MGKTDSKKEGYLLFYRWCDALIGLLRKVLTPALFEAAKKWLLLIAHYTLYAAVGLSIIIGLIGAIRGESFQIFAESLGFALAFILIQFLAKTFIDADDKLVSNNPSHLSSASFLDSIALVTALIGVVAFFYQTYLAIKLPSLEAFAMGLGTLILFALFSLLALNAKMVNVSMAAGAGAGEEALGILTFFAKAALILVSLLFGVVIIVLTISNLVELFSFFGDKFKLISAWSKARGNMENTVIAGLFPFAAYIAFVFLYLLIDIILAVLAIPGKLDKLGKKKE